MMMQKAGKVFSLFVVAAMLAAGAAYAGNKKLMTIQKAKDMARRAIVESVVGLKIRSKALWASRPSDYYKIESKVAAAIKGIQFDTPKYDPEKDVAMVTAHIRLGSVKNIIGKRIDYDDAVITRVAFATSSPQYMPQLNALRAAELNAYDELAKLIVGQKLESKSKVRNFVLESDEVRTKVLAAIWGAEVKDFGWEEDGTAFVTLRLNARYVEDILGQRIKYTGDNYVEVTGYGAPADELSETTGPATVPMVRKSTVEEVTIDIPGGPGEIKAEPEPESQGPETGGADLLR
ncbi:MAG: hypothetical protein D6819_05080 [Gammaproteobacteria bacterium]|nr:MAG: hypothetical protein D6819_05080 [Gammaproteobacteria bacterium]